MEAFSALLALCAENSQVTGDFPSQRPVTRSFGIFFHFHPNKRLSKQSWGWWFETQSRSLWRHCNVWICTQLWEEYFLALNASDHISTHGKSTCDEWISLSKEPINQTEIYFVVSLNKVLNKQSSCRCFETPWHWFLPTTMLYMTGGVQKHLLLNLKALNFFPYEESSNLSMYG